MVIIGGHGQSNTPSDSRKTARGVKAHIGIWSGKRKRRRRDEKRGGIAMIYVMGWLVMVFGICMGVGWYLSGNAPRENRRVGHQERVANWAYAMRRRGYKS